jgi:predicted  nucleic acid-binding Zn-ribbon protein
VNSRTAIVTANVLQEYKQVIGNTTSDLEDHLEEIDQKLRSLQSQGMSVSIEDTAQRRKIQEEMESTQKCLEICAKVSFHIDEVQPSVFENLLTPSNADQGPITSFDGLLLARPTTSNALEQCKGVITDASTKLQRHLQDVNGRLKELGSEPQDITDEQRAERDRIEEELNSTKQGLAICTQASEKASKERVNVFEDVKIADAGHQVIVSTFGDLILARRVSAGNKSAQWMGQMSDISLQQLASVLGQTALGRVNDPQVGATSKFESRYGTGFKLNPEKSTDAGASSE